MKTPEFVARTMPTLTFFGAAFTALRKKSSRRTAEGAMLLLLLSQAGRFAQAVGLFPIVGLARAGGKTMNLIVAGNDFYANLWPGPLFWLFVLSSAFLCGLAGMLQVVAAVQLTRHKGDVRLLRPKGEDDAEYLNSVQPAWMLADVGLRRYAALASICFFITFAFVMFVHTGFPALIYIAGYIIARWVDDNLRGTANTLRSNIGMRREAERTALQIVTMGGPRKGAA